MDAVCTLAGNLTRNPELRFTQSGRPVVAGGIAVNRRFQVNNEWTEQVSFFNFSAWGDLAENIAASFSKGDRILLAGRLEQRTYEVDGDKRSTVELVVTDCGHSLKWARTTVARVAREHVEELAGAVK